MMSATVMNHQNNVPTNKRPCNTTMVTKIVAPSKRLVCTLHLSLYTPKLCNNSFLRIYPHNAIHTWYTTFQRGQNYADSVYVYDA